MEREALLGIDLGGGGVRCLLIEPDSADSRRATLPWRGERVDSAATSELDATGVWNRVCRVVRAALDGFDGQIVGIAVASMRHASVFLDSGGDIVLATSNRDARGAGEALQLAASEGDAILQRAGRWPNPVQPLPRMLALRASSPDVWSRIARHLSLSDWLGFRLTGVLATSETQAAETLLLDLHSRAISAEALRAHDLSPDWFPPLLAAGAELGRLGDAAAAELGLDAGTPVAVAGADSQCALLGAAVTSPGAIGAVAGSTMPIQLVTATPVVDAAGRLWSSPHVVAERYVLESNGGGTGEALEWIAGVLHADAEYPVSALIGGAEDSIPGAAGVTSTIGAELMNGRALALPSGELSLSHLTAAADPGRRRHVDRAVVEGMAYGLRANVEQLEEVGAVRPEVLTLTGGMSESTLFADLLADVLDRPVSVSRIRESAPLGAAICAGVAADRFADLAEGARALCTSPIVHEPGEHRERYQELYAGWQQLREARRESTAIAAGLQMRGVMESQFPSTPVDAQAFRPHILVTSDLDDESLAALSEIGEVEYASFRTAMRLLTGPSLVEALQGVHVFVSEIDVVDGPSLAAAADLRVVASCRGDAVNLDLDACTALGIPALHTPGRNADAVADLALAYLLMLARKLPEAAAFLREPGGKEGDMGRMGKAFGQLQGRELWHKTVGLVGLGAVGRKVVARLLPFGARCLVFDPFLDGDAVRRAGATPVALAELLQHSDFVSLHAAVTEESRGLIGAAELAAMKPGSCLVNTARAALIDETALVEALSSGHLGGAALDVFAVEPPGSDHPLLALDNVIATPHVGGNTKDVAAHQGRIVIEDLLRLRCGERPAHILNPSVLAGFDWSRPRPPPGAEVVASLGRGPGPAVTDLQRKPARSEPRSRARARADSDPSSAVDSATRAMRSILEAFTAGIREDAALREFSKGQSVTLHFCLSDLDLEFYFSLADGEMPAAVGAPEQQAGVQLTLSADLLDGMFTGRRSPMQAAMEGELSFSGDAAQAMTLTHIEGDLNRLYGLARAASPDPGDLTALP